MRKSIWKKTLALFLGLFFSLFIIEGALRLLGTIENFKRLDHRSSPKTHAITIMTLGNSYTFGSGAPPGKSYPAQLEGLINSERKDRYKVINHGLGNVNSSYILENLPEWLEKDRPDIVFIMAGEPNSWNKYNYWKFLEESKGQKDLLARTMEWFRFLRVYRLAELLLNRQESWNLGANQQVSQSFKSVKKDKDSERFLAYLWLGHLIDKAVYSTERLTEVQKNEAIISLRYAVEHLKSAEGARLLSEIYLLKAEKEKSLEFLEKAIKLTDKFHFGQWISLRHFPVPTKNLSLYKKFQELKEIMDRRALGIPTEKLFLWFYERSSLHFSDNNEMIKFVKIAHDSYPESAETTNVLVGLTLTRNSEGALMAVKDTMELNPLSAGSHFLRQMNEYAKWRGDFKEKLDKVLREASLKVGRIDIQEMVEKENLEKDWIIHDLEGMIRLISEYKSKIVIQSYPPTRHGEIRFADTVLRNWWEHYQKNPNVFFMDVEKDLHEKFKYKSGENSFYSNEFGKSDNHPNESGYLEIAKLMVPYVYKLDEEYERKNR